jgi:hypothetical protein
MLNYFYNISCLKIVPESRLWNEIFNVYISMYYMICSDAFELLGSLFKLNDHLRLS